MKSKKMILISVAAVVLVVAAAGIVKFRSNSAEDAVSDAVSITEVEYTVTRNSITVAVSESGSVNPADKRVIKSEIDGTVDMIFVTEGDVVEENQVLVSLMSDSEDNNQTEINDITLNIEKSQRQLYDLYDSKKDLNIYASTSGVVSDLNIEVGDQVSLNSKIATIKDTDNSYIEVFFTKNSFDKISVGDTASVFMNKYFSTVDGMVTEIDSTPVQTGGGTFGYMVTVKISNPGGFSIGDTAQVTVANVHGSYQGMSNGKIIDVKAEIITAKTGGKITAINTENGKYINNGDVIATIEGEDLDYEIADTQNDIEKYKSQIEQLVEGDTVYSPMKGTVLKVVVSEEEVVDRNTSLMTLADLDNMEVIIAVDELDINKIKLGQKAAITSEAFKNERFSGTVSKLSMEGTNVSGVTTYDVTIKLDDRKSLMSGMNVDVVILSEKRDNVLVVPIDAIYKSEGSYMVTVKDPSGNQSKTIVQLGLATKDMVEIISGLNEGDVVVYSKVPSGASAINNNVNLRVPGMGGGQGGGRQ